MTPWIKRLLFANIGVFLLQQVYPELTAALEFVPARVLTTPWTPLTYMFIHGGFWHIVFNMIVLYFFGPRVEARLGSLGLFQCCALIDPHLVVPQRGELSDGIRGGARVGDHRDVPRQLRCEWFGVVLGDKSIHNDGRPGGSPLPIHCDGTLIGSDER